MNIKLKFMVLVSGIILSTTTINATTINDLNTNDKKNITYQNYSCEQFKNDNIGWIKDETTWYYHHKDNRLTSKWIKTGNNWCYIENSENTKKGWNKIKKTWYYVNASGADKTGWLHVNGFWYNINPIIETQEEVIEESVKDEEVIDDNLENKNDSKEVQSNAKDKTQNTKQNSNPSSPKIEQPKAQAPAPAPRPAAPVTPPKPAVQGTRNEAEAKQMLGAINSERQRLGLQTLNINSNLQAAAMVRAEEITRSFSHTRPNGLGQWNTVSHLAAGENLAMYHYSAAEANQGLFNSPGHYNNIVSASFKSVGLGSHIDINGDKFWVQLFGY